MSIISVNTNPKVLKHGGRYTTDGSFSSLVEALCDTVNKYAYGETYEYDDIEMFDEDSAYNSDFLNDLLDLAHRDPIIKKDLSKINWVHTDNTGIDGDHFADTEDGIGFMTTRSGINYFACWTCGDESLTPYVIVFYFDGKHLRAYIPVYGNAWDTLNKDEICEDNFLIRETGHTMDELLDNDIEIRTNWSMVEQDINSRLELKP